MECRPTRAEISLPQLIQNFRLIRKHVGPTVGVMPVVKADAYGHGAARISQALAADGAQWYAVTSVSEALVLRRAGITQRILTLSGFWPGEEAVLGDERLTPIVYNTDQLALLEAEGARRAAVLPFHLKVNTGMTRLGVDEPEVLPFLERVRVCRHVCLEGVLTHFASAEEFSDNQSHGQLTAFRRVKEAIAGAGFAPPLIHAANTAVTARFLSAHENLVRPGIGLYGYQAGSVRLGVEPILSLKSAVMSVRDVPAGTSLGYGATYITNHPSRIATVAAGYADGISRRLSNRGFALVGGKRVPIVGRVSMDMTMLDVTAVPSVHVGQEVVFIGHQGSERLTADEIATWADTVSYEILCNISDRVPRVYL